MKTRSLCTGAIRAVLVLAAAAILAVCAPPLDTRNEGNLRIVLAGGTSAGARALSPETIAGLSYRLDFSGPNGETLSRTLEPGTQTLSLNLALGDWTIQAEAFNDDGVVYGNGETTVTVEAGRTNDAMIPMREATPEDLPKEITAFSFDGLTPPVEVAINAGTKTVAVTVPYDTVVTSLVPTITVSSGASIDPASGDPQDFTSPVSYTVTAEDGSTETWTVTVTIASSTAKEITGFSFEGLTPPVTGTIDPAAKAVGVTVPYGTIVTGLVPTIAVSSGASIDPASGEAQDFSGPVSYTVTAGDGSTETWFVTVTIAPSTAKEITGFSFEGLTPPVTGTIDPAAKTIAVTVPYDTVVTSLVPTITVSSGASVDPLSGVTKNFTSPIPYTVTAEDGSTETWTVTVTIAPSTAKEITGFSFTNPPVTGTIDTAAKTIAVSVFDSTDRTNLVPTITVSSGATVSPLSDASQNFTGPVIYTVTAEDGSIETWTVTVTVRGPLTTIAEVTAYLASASGNSTTNPVPLLVELNLADTGGNGWSDLLGAIQTADKFVKLDLSECGMSGTEFDPYMSTATGESKIVSLVLPEVALSIKTGSYPDYTFRYFSGLKNVTGENVTSIGGFAFYGCSSLVSIDFPAVQSIGDGAFMFCGSLASINLLVVTNIGGNSVFYECSSLASISLPASLTSINGNPFPYCYALTNITVDGGNTIYKHSDDKKMLLSKDGATLIAYPTATGTVTLPTTITRIGESAFSGCTGLESVNLPGVTSIGQIVFTGCTSLDSISLPEVTSIGDQVFNYTGTTPLTVTLGNTVPTLVGTMFGGSDIKIVTVKVPNNAAWSDKTGTFTGTDTTDNWGNGFRGGGWTGSVMMNSSWVNANINLTFETYTP